MRPRRPVAEPKPFVWVPLPADRPRRESYVPHERFTGLSGKLDFRLRVESDYLFVGSGGYEFDPKGGGDRPDVWYTFYRRNGQLCIPGTSLKGAIRSIVEAISNSCVGQRKGGEHVARSHEPCRFKGGQQERLCPACRIFGLTGLRGRVRFDDALAQGQIKPDIVKIAELWPPRLSGGRKFYQVKKFMLLDRRPQPNFRFIEAVPKGAVFRGALWFENLSPDELGLVCLAMGLSPHESERFTPKVGGAKPRCLGAVSFEAERLRLRDEVGLRGLLHPRVVEAEFLTAYLKAWRDACQQQGLLHTKSWELFVKGMGNKGEPCPRGVY
jgi:CRISPR/Cas system CSM-associated protein Csm3 (group 7 of RAMP superfamily)